jgi:4-alpha-glucanotransferase
MKEREFSWWVNRIRHSFNQIDILRIDHFRGFESYWRIPAEEQTAINGEWVPGPGIDFFSALKEKLGSLPIIAEDLGFITSDVEALLSQTGFPGMRVLQFAFGTGSKEKGSTNKYLPHNYTPRTIVYTGTHDNPSTLDWYGNMSQQVKREVLEYINFSGKDVVGELIRLAWSSAALMCVIPLQDLLRLGTESRMNVPGTLDGNWQWRFSWDQLTEEEAKELRALSRIYGR